MKDKNAHFNPRRNLDQFDLEAEKEGSAIRQHNAVRVVARRKPKRGGCRQTRHAA